MMMNRPDKEALQREARYLYSYFFDRCPDIDTMERYVAAHLHFDFVESESDRSLIDNILSYQLHPEAIEYVLRLRNHDNTLTRKVAILHYIAECKSENHATFINCNPGLLRGCTDILKALLRVPYLLIRGFYQVKKYGLS